jgi:hypothetical protein
MIIKRKTIYIDVEAKDDSECIDIELGDVVGTETGHNELQDWITIWYVEKE